MMLISKIQGISVLIRLYESTSNVILNYPITEYFYLV